MAKVSLDYSSPLNPKVKWEFKHTSLDTILIQYHVSGLLPIQYHFAPDAPGQMTIPTVFRQVPNCKVSVSGLVYQYLKDNVVAYHCVAQENCHLPYGSMHYLNEPKLVSTAKLQGFITITKPKYHEVTLSWKFGSATVGNIVFIQLKTLNNHKNNWFFHVVYDDLDSKDNQFRIPRKLPPGQKFEVSVMAMKPHMMGDGTLAYECEEQLFAQFRTELSVEEIIILLQRATVFLTHRYNHNTFTHLDYFIRNKPPVYFEDIMTNHCGIMNPYFKDITGDPASPINRELKGVFFGTAIDPETGLPPIRSIYGSKRINIPCQVLLNHDANLYFVDFYCYKIAHYVTLVLTKGGSRADSFCKRKLVELDKFNNDFLRITQMGIAVTSRVWVEVFFTESIDLVNVVTFHGAFFSDTETVKGKNHLGVPKNPLCERCNLYPGKEDFDESKVVDLSTL